MPDISGYGGEGVKMCVGISGKLMIIFMTSDKNFMEVAYIQRSKFSIRTLVLWFEGASHAKVTILVTF